LKINGFVSIHVPQATAPAALKVERNGLLELPDAAVHPPRDTFFSTGEKGLGLIKIMYHPRKNKNIVSICKTFIPFYETYENYPSSTKLGQRFVCPPTLGNRI
jgi:hypothetical protein